MFQITKWTFLLLCIVFTASDDELQILDDLLPDLMQGADLLYHGNNNTTPVQSIGQAMDLEKLNLNKVKGKLNILRDDFLKKKSHRRQAAIPVKGGGYMAGTGMRTKRKICDLILQTIYMARHKIRAMAGDKYFKITDTGYRIAYLFRRLSSIMKVLLTIYWTMANHTTVWEDITPYLILHHKAVRFYTDFNNIWWVLVRVDGAYKSGTVKDSEELNY